MLSRILDLRPGEGRTLTLLGGHLFLILAANTLLATAAEALFLAVYPYSWIPYTYLAGAFWTVVAAMIYGRLKARFAPKTTSKITVGGSVLALLGLGAVLRWAPAAGPFVLQMVTPAFGVLGGMESASLVARALETRQARRLYPSISSIGGIGATLGAFLVAWVGTRIGPLGSLAIAGLFLLGALVLAVRVVGFESRRDQAAPAAWGEVFRNRFTLALVALVCVSGVLTTCVKFQLGACIKESMSKEEITSYLGHLYGALNAVSIGFGFLVTRRLVRSLGVGGAIFVYPALLLCCGVGGVLVPGLALTSTALFLERLFRQNLQRPLLNIATMPLPAGLAARTSLAIRGAVETPAIAITSIVLLLTAARVPWQTISYLVVGAAVVGVGCVMVARPRYARALVAALHARRLQAPAGVQTPAVLSADARVVLREQLQSADPDAVDLALAWIDGAIEAPTVDLIRSHWSGWAVANKVAAVRVLGRAEDPAAQAHLLELGDAPEPEVRAAWWAVAPAAAAAERVALALRDPSPTVVLAVIKRWVDLKGDPAVLPADLVEQGLRAEDPERRAGAVVAVLGLGAASPEAGVEAVLRAHPAAAVEIAAKVPSPALLPYLLETLATSGGAAGHRAALLRLGAEAVPGLAALIEDGRRGPAVVEVLVQHALHGVESAADAVRQALVDHRVAVRESVRMALGAALRQQGGEHRGERGPVRTLREALAPLEVAVEFECAACERIWPARRHPDPVVARESQAAFEAGIGRLFTLLDAWEGGKPYRRVELAVFSDASRVRGFAVEALDEMLPSPWRSRILAMLDTSEVIDDARSTAAALADPLLAEVLAAVTRPTPGPTTVALALQRDPLFAEFRLADLLDLLDRAARGGGASGNPGLPSSAETGVQDRAVRAAELSDALLHRDGAVAGLPLAAVWQTLAHRPDAALAWLHGVGRVLTPEAPGAAAATATALSLASRVEAGDPGGSPVRDGEVWRRGFYLRKAPVISGLRSERLAMLATICRSLTVSSGERVVHEGQPAAHGYVIVEGSFEVSLRGARQTVLGEGETFGVLALLTGRDRLATVRALTGGELLAIERHDFQDLITTEPGLCRSLSRQLARFARELG